MTTRETAPPWNYGPMLALSPLSLPMCLLGVAGVLATLRSPPAAPIRKAVAFAVACIGIYWAAMLYLFLRIPVYSTVKATYTLGLLPCYVLLITAGLALVWRHPLARAATAGYVCAWAGCSYFAFFAIG